MKESYLDYAMSVITQELFLMFVMDEPVHRRILYAMGEMGLTASAKTRNLPLLWERFLVIITHTEMLLFMMLW
jgi:hypothetical protein